MSTLIGIAMLIVLLGVLALMGWQAMVSRRNRLGRARVGTLFQLKPGMELTLTDAEKKAKMTRVLETLVRYVDGWQERMQETESAYSFEVHASGTGGYGVYMWVPDAEAKHISSTLRAVYEYPVEVPPQEEIMSILHSKLSDEHGYVRENVNLYTAEFKLARPSYLPIAEWLPGKHPDDPMEQIFGILDGFRGNNAVAGVILTVKPADKDWRQPGLDFLRSVEYGVPMQESLGDRVKSIGEDEKPQPKRQRLDTFQKDDMAAVTKKAKQNAFEAVVRLYSSDWATFELLRSTLEVRFRDDRNSLRLVSPRVSLLDMKARWFDRSDMVLSLDELASIFHFPDSKTKGERLRRGASKSSMPPEGLPTIREGSSTDIFSLLERIGVEGRKN